MILLANARIVTPGGIIEGWLGVEGDSIGDVAAGPAPTGAGPVVDLRGRWLVPGFIDLHVHGGGGASFTDDDPDAIMQVVGFHKHHGTARLLASVAAAPLEEMAAVAAAVAGIVEGGRGRHLVGTHLEGPFLDQGHCGALDPSFFLPPSEASLAALLAAGRGTVRVVTIAPGLPGSEDVVRKAVAGGAVAAIGHSGAGYAEAAAAIEAGATLVTHLFNGMARFHHREPGIVGAALDRDDVVCELIADGVHVHDAALRLAFAVKGARGVALITDAIAAAGCGDGTFALGRREVRVRGDRAELVDGGRLAGSTLTMDEAVRVAVRRGGVPLVDVVTAAATTPARVLGIDDRAGTIAPGYDADLVVLDDNLAIAGVILEGRPLHGLYGTDDLMAPWS